MATMEAQLPYKTVVLFIACGAMVFLIVFIFAKRQITRFALRSNRVPHAAIGSGVPKMMKREIDKRLKRVAEICYEPFLLSPSIASQPNSQSCQFYFRMKAVDEMKVFDKEVQALYPDVERRRGENLRRYLLNQRQKGCLVGLSLEVIDKFSEMYEHARHDPTDFTEEHYREYMDLLNQMTSHARYAAADNITASAHPHLSESPLAPSEDDGLILHENIPIKDLPVRPTQLVAPYSSSPATNAESPQRGSGLVFRPKSSTGGASSASQYVRVKDTGNESSSV